MGFNFTQTDEEMHNIHKRCSIACTNLYGDRFLSVVEKYQINHKTLSNASATSSVTVSVATLSCADGV